METQIPQLHAQRAPQKPPFHMVRKGGDYKHADSQFQHAKCPDELKSCDALALPIHFPKGRPPRDPAQTNNPRANKPYPGKCGCSAGNTNDLCLHKDPAEFRPFPLLSVVLPDTAGHFVWGELLRHLDFFVILKKAQFRVRPGCFETTFPIQNRTRFPA